MRKVVYYLPNLHVQDDIELGHCRLLKAATRENAKTLIDPKVFGEINGTLIEVDGFCSGDIYCPAVNQTIYRELELVKFSYFSTSVSNHMDFVSNDTFEVFCILEKNRDPSFEHKVCFSNGINDYLMSLDQYYNSKALRGKFSHVSLIENNLKYYELVKSLPLSEDDFMIISIFNKTRNLYTNFDFIDRVLFARMATEKLAKKLKWKLPSLSNSFLENALKFVQKEKNCNEYISKFYEQNVNGKHDLIKGNLEIYLSKLKDARHALAHAGEQDESYDNICYFMAWFPIAFLLSFDVKHLSEDLALRTIFLLAASSVDIKKWQERDPILTFGKRTVLESYEYASNLIPIVIAKGDDKHVELSLQGLSNTLNSN